MWRQVCVLALAMGLFGAVLSGQEQAVPKAKTPPDLTGTYKSDTAEVKITKNGTVYNLLWNYPDGSQWIGVGIIEGEVFSVAWDLPGGGNLGVASYKLEKGTAGTDLVGHWAAYQDPRATADKLVFVKK